MYKLDQNSIIILNQCHEDLRVLVNEAIKASPYLFSVNQGHISSTKQFDKYREQKNKIKDEKIYFDGYIKVSKHNYFPAEAFKIDCFVNNNKVHNDEVYSIVASHIIDVAEDLFEAGRITNRVAWGGNWKKFKDVSHFQI
jgi:hypothetical protein